MEARVQAAGNGASLMPAWPLDLLQEAMRLSAAGWTPKQIGRHIGKSSDAVWQRLKRRDDTLPKAAFQGKGGIGSESPLSAPRVTPEAASPVPPAFETQSETQSRTQVLADTGFDCVASNETRNVIPPPPVSYPVHWTEPATVPDSRIPNAEHRGSVFDAIAGRPHDPASASPAAAASNNMAAILDQATPLVKESILELTAADEIHAPAIHTSRTRGEAYLCIPDTQDPYAAPAWLSFALAVAREEGVEINTPGRVLHTGDEADQYHASMFDHDPDAPHTPRGELKAYRERVAETAAAFPYILHAASNHGDRWKKRALHCGFPAELFRVWAEVIGAPAGWRWDRKWRIPASKQPFLLEHGDWGAQGLNGTRQRVLDNGIPTVHGHQHATAAVVWVATIHRPQEWGMNAACLIDTEAKAFDYGKASRFQPTRGIGVIRDGGRMPIWYPYGGNYP